MEANRLKYGDQRKRGKEKLPFMYGLRGKAAWRFNRVVLSVALIIFLYFKVNEARLSVMIAEEVSLGWKWGGLFAMLASVGYGFWRMGRRIHNPALRQSPRVWLVLPVAAAFVLQ